MTNESDPNNNDFLRFELVFPDNHLEFYTGKKIRITGTRDQLLVLRAVLNKVVSSPVATTACREVQLGEEHTALFEVVMTEGKK